MTIHACGPAISRSHVEIACRVGQSVRVVDAHAVDQALVEPALDLDVGGVEHRAVLLAQPGQRGDREEPPVAAHPVAPADQPVVLAVVHLGAGPVPVPGAMG